MFLLRGAAITFFTHGENKEPGTAVHVFVTNRDATTATPDRIADFVAHRLDEERYEQGGDLIGENRTPYLAFGLGLGANQTFDDGSEVPFSLGLGAFDLAFDDIVLPAVAIHIQPDGSDRWIFDFELALFFIDDADGATRSLKFESARDGLAGIVLDQDNRTHYAILDEHGLLPAPPRPVPDTDAVLDRVTIEFATHHDDKKADTRLNLHVINRLRLGQVQDLAVGVNVLPGKRFETDGPLPNRRDRVSWSSSPVDLPLAAPGIRLADVVLPVVYVVIDPPGHDRWIFDYEVTYEFADSQNAGGKRHVFVSRTVGVVLDQDRRKHEGVYNGTPFPAVAPATAPPLTVQPAGHREPFPKIVSIPFLERKFDEFVNGRGGPIDGENPALLRIRVDNSGNFAHDTTPESYLDLQALIATGLGVTYVPHPRSMGQLDHGYFAREIESSGLKLSVDPASTTPLTLTVEFETAGPLELPSKVAVWPNIDIQKLSVGLDLTLGIDRGVDVQGGTATLVDLLTWVHDLQSMTFQTTEGPNGPQTHCTGTFLGQPVDLTLEADFDGVIAHFVAKVVHLDMDTDVDFIVEGILRTTLLRKIFGMLTTPDRFTGRTARDGLNAWVTSWLLGGIADDPENTDGNNCVLDDIHIELADPANGIPEDRIRISYAGPQRAFVPVMPADWPKGHDFSPGPLAGIEHLVVLTMENRSFDHMLGYLRLPSACGGAGRTDVDGLTGAESNPHKGQMFGSSPVTGTVFSPDPPHGHAPVTRAINGGRMDGFITAFAEQHGDSGAEKIMGHHTAATVPQYDALARDFAVGHRWFASHPGPTFCNRFYELTGRLNLNPHGFWEFDNTSPIRPVFTPTIFDYLTGGDPVTGEKLTWRYFERGYCFLRFFEKYTFNTEHIIDIDDPKGGFFELARTGRLPQVAFVDPHFVELPPLGNCDGPPADVALGQELVQRIVEAVVAGPAWEKTLLVIVYDEHGGFYDHVPPPEAVKVSDDAPIATLGVRVPAIVVSPWVGAGAVFGHDGDPEAGSAPLHFDHTSILKTIARRFLSGSPPYLSARYAAASDLAAIVLAEPRRPQFLPFLRYTAMLLASQQMLTVDGDPAPGTPLSQDAVDGSAAQDFSFEDAGDGFVRIRSQAGNFYLSVDESSADLAVRQDVRYPPAAGGAGPRPALQRFKITPVGISHLTHDHYVISSEAHPDLELQPAAATSPGSPIVLGLRGAPGQAGPPNAWRISNPLLD
jgi:phospholipase C